MRTWECRKDEDRLREAVHKLMGVLAFTIPKIEFVVKINGE